MLTTILNLIPEPPDIAKISAGVHRWAVFLASSLGLLALVWTGIDPGVFHISSGLYDGITGILLAVIGIVTLLRDRTNPQTPPTP